MRRCRCCRTRPAATPRRRSREMRELWTRYIPFEALPQFHNPRGGYIHNENDSPHFTNVREPIRTTNAYPNIEPPMLRLRSQHAISLIDTNTEAQPRGRRPAEAQLPDAARRPREGRSRRRGEGDEADRRRRRGARAAPALEQHRGARQPRLDAVRSLVSALRAGPPRQRALRAAVDRDRPAEDAARPRRAGARGRGVRRGPSRKRRSGTAGSTSTWGDVHRVRRGPVDVPVGGCPGRLGCFRVLSYGATPTASSSPTPATAGSSPSSSAPSRARIPCSPTARAPTRSRPGTPIRRRCSRAGR